MILDFFVFQLQKTFYLIIKEFVLYEFICLGTLSSQTENDLPVFSLTLDSLGGSFCLTSAFITRKNRASTAWNKLVRIMSMKRECRRWPYGFVMNMLNIAVLNSMFVFKNTRQLTQAQLKILHFDFLIAYGKQMIEAEILKRSKTCTRKNVLAAIRSLRIVHVDQEGNMNANPSEEHESVLQLSTPMRCTFCERKRDRKSRIACCQCKKPMCNDHRSQNCKKYSLSICVELQFYIFL